MEYHSADPINNKATYTELDNVSFNINNAGRKLILGSVRLEADLRINNAGVTRCVAANETGFHNRVGAHGLFDSFTTEAGNIGILENISSDAGRYVNLVSSATKTEDMLNNASEICELKSTSQRISKMLACGSTIDDNTVQDIDFSIKPMICLNRNVVGGTLSFRKAGFMKLSMNLARNYEFLNSGTSATANYVLTNLRLTYRTVEDDGSDEEVQLRSIVSIKSTIQSNFANVSSNVPAVCTGVTVCFMRTSRENNQTYDNYNLERLQDFQSIQYLFNSSNNQYVSYIIDTREEMLEKGIESLADTGYNCANGKNVRANNVEFAGLSFDSPVDLSTQRFNIQIKDNDVQNLGGYNVYQFFHSSISV